MTVLIGADAVGRLEVTDEARGGKRVARLQEHLPHLPVVRPGVEERARSLGKHGPACGGEEGERQTPLVLARSRPKIDPARQLATVDAQPARRLLETEAVHTARAPFEFVEETSELPLGVGPPAAGAKEWLQLAGEGIDVAAAAG